LATEKQPTRAAKQTNDSQSQRNEIDFDEHTVEGRAIEVDTTGSQREISSKFINVNQRSHGESSQVNAPDPLVTEAPGKQFIV
jgi:hypothetical protein